MYTLGYVVLKISIIFGTTIGVPTSEDLLPNRVRLTNNKRARRPKDKKSVLPMTAGERILKLLLCERALHGS
jgi:hypothetical protein